MSPYLVTVHRIASADLFRSEGFPRTAYFIPGCDGMGVGAISEIVPASAAAAAASFTKME